LIVRFKDEQLRKLCEHEREMGRKLGTDCARRLRARLEDLASADTVADLVAGKPHPLSGDRAGQFGVRLHGGKRLVFEPTLTPPPQRSAGGIDWNAVDDVTIVYVGNYHD